MLKPLGVVAVVLALLASGCAAAKTGRPYAGLDAYDVGTAARNIIDQEQVRPASLLHDRELVVADEEKGLLPQTRRAVWVVSLENFDRVKSKYCLYVWGKFTPFQGSDVTYDIQRCPARSDV